MQAHEPSIVPSMPISIVFFRGGWGLPVIVSCPKTSEYTKQPRVPLQDLEKEWKLEPEDFEKVKAMIIDHLGGEGTEIRPAYAV